MSDKKVKSVLDGAALLEASRDEELDVLNGRNLKAGYVKKAAVGVGVLISLATICSLVYLQISKAEVKKNGNGPLQNSTLESVLIPQRNLSRDVGASVAPVTPKPREPDPAPAPDPAPVTKVTQKSDKPKEVYDEDTRLRKFNADGWGSMDTPIAASGTDQGAQGESFASESDSELADKLNPVKLQRVKASVLKNRDLIITAGTDIPCSLTNYVDSSVPGFIGCMVTEDVYGSTGRVKLIDKFTKVTGRAEGNVAQGSTRIFAAWDRVETPEGVIVDIGSPATDQLGTAGMGGQVDNHWMDRYGNALLISIIQDSVSIGLAKAAGTEGNNNVNINTGATAGTAQDMATEALKNSINIPRTLYKKQGELVNVMVSRDLDFSGVYSLEYSE